MQINPVCQKQTERFQKGDHRIDPILFVQEPLGERINRREALMRIGGLGSLLCALTSFSWNPLRAQQPRQREAEYRVDFVTPGRRDPGINMILIELEGGVPNDVFHPRDNRVSEDVRGPFLSRSTNVPGVSITELLPFTSRVMNKVHIIRGVTGNQSNHPNASALFMTGDPQLLTSDFYSEAKIAGPTTLISQHQRQRGIFEVNNVLMHTNYDVKQGLDPKPYAGVYSNRDGINLLFPHNTQSDSIDFSAIESLSPRDRKRFHEQVSLLESFEKTSPLSNHPAQNVQDYGKANQQARALILNNKLGVALNLEKEPTRVRDRYGRWPFAESLLRARRLMEVRNPGIRIATVTLGDFDVHGNMNEYLPMLLKKFDQPFGALVEDLEQRGLLENTAVVVVTEFGRTPKMNGAGGRDHWPQAFCAAVAGLGIPGGATGNISDDGKPSIPFSAQKGVDWILGLTGRARFDTLTGQRVSTEDWSRVLPDFSSFTH